MMLLFVIIIGLVIGSFLGAFTWRYERGKSILKGRSLCPNCGGQISWRDNIPVISYVLLRGKCRNCSKPISLRYPIIEIATALVFLFTYLFFSNSASSVNFLLIPYYLLIFSLLISIFVIDYETRIIPDELVFGGLGITLLFKLLTDSDGLYANLVAGFSFSLFLLTIHLLTKGKGMGLGDVKFAILAGVILGFQKGTIWLFLAFLIGGCVGIMLILMRRAKLKEQIAFGPFLVVSFFISFFFGTSIFRFLFPIF